MQKLGTNCLFIHSLIDSYENIRNIWPNNTLFIPGPMDEEKYQNVNFITPNNAMERQAINFVYNKFYTMVLGVVWCRLGVFLHQSNMEKSLHHTIKF